MSQVQWVTSHVERLLQDEWSVCRVATDSDGDYPFRNGAAACWVSVLDSEPVMVRVFSHAVIGLKPSLKLFSELNEIAGQSLSASIGLRHGCVVVSQTVSPLGLTRPVLTQALQSVAALADDVGPLIAATFGGHTPFPIIEDSTEDAA